MPNPIREKLRGLTDIGKAVMRMVAKGISKTARVKIELKTRPNKALGPFLNHGKEVNVKNG